MIRTNPILLSIVLCLNASFVNGFAPDLPRPTFCTANPPFAISASASQECVSTKSTRTFYEVLGATPYATRAELKQLYLRLAKETHPDSNLDKNTVGEFHKIADAWRALSDPRDRLTYDRRLWRKKFVESVENNASELEHAIKDFSKAAKSTDFSEIARTTDFRAVATECGKVANELGKVCMPVIEDVAKNLAKSSFDFTKWAFARAEKSVGTAMQNAML